MHTCVQFFLNLQTLHSISTVLHTCSYQNYRWIIYRLFIQEDRYIDILCAYIYVYLKIINLYFVDNFSVCFNAKIKNVLKSCN